MPQIKEVHEPMEPSVMISTQEKGGHGGRGAWFGEMNWRSI